MLTRLFGAILFLAITAPAHASFVTEGDYVVVPVTFTGTITESLTESAEFRERFGGNIVVQNGDGNFIPYTGPVPDYPYKAGDKITLSFEAVVPSPSAIQNRGIAPSSNGTYELPLAPQMVDPDLFPAIGYFRNVDVSGPIAPAINQGSDNGLAIIYDPSNGKYFINPDRNDRAGTASTDLFSIGFFSDAPTFAYDANSNLLTNVLFSDFGLDPVTGALSGTFDSGRIPIGYISASDGSNIGLGGEIRFSNAVWNLPFFSNGPTPVPAPPAALLFALGFGALAWRRRNSRFKKAKAHS